jgi:exopolysaccharide production protein ExoZ
VLAGTLLFFLLGKQETEASRAVTWGLPLALVVQGAVRIPVNDAGVLKRMCRIVGDASYSIYLVQFIVIPPVTAVLARFLLKDAGTWRGATFVAAIVACSLVIGVVTYYFVELPMLGRLRALRRRRRSTLACTGATAVASANNNVR